jgi:hypothetical protein
MGAFRSRALGFCLLVAGAASAGALTPPAQTFVLEHGPWTVVFSPEAAQLATGDALTAEVWVYRVGPVGAVVLALAPRDGDTVPAFQLSLGEGESAVATVVHSNVAGSDWYHVDSGPVVPLRRWTHLAATVGGGALSLYVDAVLVGQAPALPMTTPTPRRWSIGCSINAQGQPTSGSLAAAMRQVRIWNRALSAQEIAASATGRLAGDEPGLVALWPMDDAAGPTMRDLGPHGLHAQRGTAPGDDVREPRWIRAAVLEAGPFFAWDEPQIVLPGCGAPENPCMSRGALVDLERDGDADLITMRSHPHYFRMNTQLVLRNDGSGNYSDATQEIYAGPPLRTRGGAPAVIADMNGDGLTDIVFSSPGPDHPSTPGGQNYLLLQEPDGRMRDVTATHLPIKSNFNHGVCAGDLDGDGDVDLVVGTIYAMGIDHLNQTHVELNDGTGHFSMGRGRLPWERGPAWAPEDSNGGGRGCVTLDTDRDGDQDVLLGQDGRSHVLLVNDGDGSFSLAPPGALPANPVAADGMTFNLHVADFDGNSISDVAGLYFDAGEGSSTPFVWFGRGDGTFADASRRVPETWRRSGSADQEWIANIGTADVDGNGWPDLVVYAVGLGTSAHLYLNKGDGHFVDATDFLPFGGARAAQGDLGDIDGDLDIDFVLFRGDRLEVLRQLKTPDLTLLPDAVRPLRRRVARAP